jgi:hypothetical protein
MGGRCQRAGDLCCDLILPLDAKGATVEAFGAEEVAWLVVLQLMAQL